MPNPERLTGAILRLHRGFAILRSDAGAKFYAHASSFLQYDDFDRAQIGDRVTFDPGPLFRDLPQARAVHLGAQPEREAVVSRCWPDRGFALATDKATGHRLLVHASAMPRSQFDALQVGARILFAAVVETERGPRAAGVVLLD